MVSYKNHLDLLKNIALSIAGAETPKEALEVVLHTFEKILRYNNAAVIFFDEAMTNLNVFRTRGMKERVQRYVMEELPKHTREFIALIEKNNLQPVIWDDIWETSSGGNSRNCRTVFRRFMIRSSGSRRSKKS